MTRTPFQKNKSQTPKGFTLIELLVVVAIIGLLSSVVMASLNTARARGRDARRLSDLQQVQIALELYRSDNGGYPATPDLGDGEGGYYRDCGGFHTLSGSSGWIPNLAPTYIKQLPAEPLKPYLAGYDCYRYISDGKSYMVMAGTDETYSAARNPSPRLIQPGGNFAKYSPDPLTTLTPPGSW